MINLKECFSWVVIAVLSVTGAVSAGAQTAFPNKPVHLVVGAGPGDNTDIFARLLAEELKTRLGQPVIVENKPGAAGLLSGNYVSAARPDGYTLLFGNMSSLIIGPQVVSPMPYDSTKAFTPIIKTQEGASVLAVHSAVPAKSLAELIELAKSKPKAVKFGLSTLGSAQHLVMELVQARTGIQLNTVPYRGTAAALQSAVTGEADITIAGVLQAQPHVDSGAIRPLAVYSARPASQYPNLPTIAAALKIPELDHDFWFGVVGPAGMSKDVVSKLSAEISAAMASPVIKDMLTKNAQFFVQNSPEDFAKSVAAQWDTFGKVARDNKIEVK